MRLKSARLALSAAAIFAASPRSYAGEDYDMERLTPVPADTQIPLEDFFRPAIFQSPQLNPSGTKIAAIVTVKSDSHLLLVYDVATHQEETVGGPGDSDMYSARWLNDKRLVFQLSALKLFGVGFFAANVGELSHSYPLEQYYGTRLVSVQKDNRTRPLVWNSRDALKGGRDLGVASLNTDLPSKVGAISRSTIISGTMEGVSAARDVQENNEHHIEERFPSPPGIVLSYMADKDGHLEYAVVDLDHEHTLFRYAEGQWTRCPINTEKVGIVGPGNRPGQLLVVGGAKGAEPRPLRFMDAATGTFGETIVSDKSYDFDGGVYRDPVSGEIIGAYSQRDGPSGRWFIESYRSIQKVLNATFPGVFVQIIDSNEAQTLFLVGTYSDRQPMIYHLVDISKHTASLVRKTTPWIDPKRMRPMQILRVKTRDGFTIDAYLTLPDGATKAKPAPMVVLSHGGPWLRDSWHYNPEVQFLASRGYAVLQPNYRGSPGLNWQYPNHEYWDFLKMHYDVADATRAVIASGIVDPDRVAIMGGSFGGYLAIEGIVDDPTLYRCAVTISGVYDWARFFREKRSNFEQFGDLSFDTMMLREGDPDTQPEKFDRISPVHHIDHVRVPVLVSHGGNDTIADISQSTHLISELEKYHVTYETDIVSAESHGMQHMKNEVELYRKIEAFLAKNLQPRAPAGSN
jgi:acetyl esterase/lipase